MDTLETFQGYVFDNMSKDFEKYPYSRKKSFFKKGKILNGINLSNENNVNVYFFV